MTNYWDLDQSDIATRRLDSDLGACLEYNPQPFTLDDIEIVLAVWEGENDREDWRWVIRLHDGRFVLLQGGCDYTGWDCQSWAETTFVETPEAACLVTRTAEREDVYAALMAQIVTGKSATWREANDALFDYPKRVNIG